MNQTAIMQSLREMYARAAALYYGEEITQLEHALQCYDLAMEADADAQTRVAAFLHDIGHLSSDNSENEFGLPEHDAEGAGLLEAWGFPPAVTEAVRMHVQAKRYLVAMNPEYVWSLSEASVHTLDQQGGPFNAEECLAFQAIPFYEEAIRLRLWDDHGKGVFALRTEVPEQVWNDVQLVLQQAKALE
jgi:putative nucleotidyltransferase with HDIG domain